MAKGGRENGESVSDSTGDGGDLKEWMQKLVFEIGILNPEVANLKHLD